MAGPVDLLFKRSPLGGSPVNLIFGEVDTPLPADFSISIAGELPALAADVRIAQVADVTIAGLLPPLIGLVKIAAVVDVTIAASLPALTATMSALYVSGADRPTVAETAGPWQQAVRTETGINGVMQRAQAQPALTSSTWEDAIALSQGTSAAHQDADRSVRTSTRGRHQQALHLALPAARARHQGGISLRRTVTDGFQQALRLGTNSARSRFQDGLRDRRNWAAAHWQKAGAHSFSTASEFSQGISQRLRWGGRYQEAMRPPPGTSTHGPGPHTPCYTPPPASAVGLLFQESWSGSTDLLFVCENHGQGPGPGPGALITVPVRRVYVLLNTSSLRRVDTDEMLPTFAMSMSLDVDSWTWSFSASLPGRALSSLQPASPGEPILLEVMVNGVAYKMQAEKFSRDRTYDTSGLKISGRGRAAILDAPHAPVLSYTNTDERTAQQLMGDVLTENNVPIGWDIDWQAVDWSIPAGLFVHQGEYISALKAIAASAGSYLQPHPTDQVLRVLPRYPALPWNWSALTPDYEIPSAVGLVEGIEWMNKALYNRVYVSGVRDGVLGQVTRAGTDGGLIAPMITDPLITTAAAARQRGTASIADTGAQADVTIKMPVLAETGIIVPGKFTRYVDGSETRIGLTRKVTVDINMPEIWQTITLETHV